jgi:hypothetical protein
MAGLSAASIHPLAQSITMGVPGHLLVLVPVLVVPPEPVEPPLAAVVVVVPVEPPEALEPAWLDEPPEPPEPVAPPLALLDVLVFPPLAALLPVSPPEELPPEPDPPLPVEPPLSSDPPVLPPPFPEELGLQAETINEAPVRAMARNLLSVMLSPSVRLRWAVLPSECAYSRRAPHSAQA